MKQEQSKQDMILSVNEKKALLQRQKELEEYEKEIDKGHRDKVIWSKKLYPVQHTLEMERTKISLLQVELGGRGAPLLPLEAYWARLARAKYVVITAYPRRRIGRVGAR